MYFRSYLSIFSQHEIIQNDVKSNKYSKKARKFFYLGKNKPIKVKRIKDQSRLITIYDPPFLIRFKRRLNIAKGVVLNYL